jgi:ribose transport system ATP-binding protein
MLEGNVASQGAGTSEGAYAVEMVGIRRHFPGVDALKGVDLKVGVGEIHGLAGENGAGKSTLMKILSGAERKDAGHIILNGKEVHMSGPADALALGISTVYQETSLAPHLSVAENLFVGRWPKFAGGVIDRRRLMREAELVLERLGVELPLRAQVNRLTIAQQQMTEIARALSHDVNVLILDEPTSALADNEVAALFAVLRDLKAQGISVIFISHELDEMLELCDRISVMRDGELVGERAAAETNVLELVRMMVGRTLGEMYPKRAVPVGEELLRVEGLRVRSKKSAVSFSVRAGEVVGFAGLLGAGRTSLMQAVVGAVPSEAGRIYVRGRPVRVRNPEHAIRQGIGYLTDDRRRTGLAGVLGVGQNLTLASLPQFARVGVIKSRKEVRATSDMVEALRIVTPSLRQPVALLSGGNQQKTVLGRWLLADVDVLILDQPTRGIDVGAKLEIYGIINNLASAGKALILVSDYLPELLGMSDRVIVMREGGIIAEFDRAEATQEAVLLAASGHPPGRGGRATPSRGHGSGGTGAGTDGERATK